MKETRVAGSTPSSSTSKNKEEVLAFKSEANKSQRPKPKHPCSPGKHNPLAYHPAWHCFKLLKEERNALLPKEVESHLNLVDIENHLTNINENRDQPTEDKYIKVAAYLVNSDSDLSPVLDSRASHHMVNDSSIFHKIKEVNVKIHTSGLKQRVDAVAIGNVYLKDDTGRLVKLKDFLLAPDLHRPLVSMNRLCNHTVPLSKNQDSFKVDFDKNFQLSGSIVNNILELKNRFAIKAISLYSSLKPVNWHTRFGHPSFSYLKRIIPDTENVDCNTCKMCKGTKNPFKGKFSPTSEVLEAVHLDLVGPFQTISEGGAQYFLTIVNQHSGFKSVKMLQHKSETLSQFEDWVAWAENQTSRHLKRVISDNGGEFKNLFFKDFCRKRGISQQFLLAYTPENNGISEQSNRAILDKACCLFAQAYLSLVLG